ncbi:MAG TPA: hypothetical protein DCL77_14380 [Prolixibacteraceae bacterium]|jgi:protease-4|nr:hypothetical protein [Prolixibacteraceae bacterium]
MKTSQFLTSILSEPWMMLPQAVEAHLPLIAAWLMGHELKLEEKGKLELQMAYAGGISPGYPEDIAEFPAGSVAIVNLKSALTKYDGMCSYGAVSTANLIMQLGMAKNIAGVVLDIDGPGGSVNAISPLVEAIQLFQSMRKPIVAHADMIASAHYYVGMHADLLVMDNTISSMAGSIGVMTTVADYRKKLEAMGVTMQAVYADQSTHKNQEFEQAKEGNMELLKKNVLNPMALKFQSAVKEQRYGKLDMTAEGLLNGACFFAEDAVRFGLADEIGSLSTAIQRVLDQVEIRKFMGQ